MASPTLHMAGSKPDDAFCDMNPGLKGLTFRRWVRHWQESAQSQFEKEDDYSWYDVCTETDQGSANGPAMPQGGGALSTARRSRKRRHLAVKRALSKTQSDPRLRNMIISLDNGDEQTNDSNGVGVGARAWRLLVSECDEPLTALEVNNVRSIFYNMSIKKDIGIDANSNINLSRHINETLSVLPPDQQPSDTARAEMVLNCISIDGNGPLCLEATKEYQANEARQFVITGVALPNNRDLPSIIRYFDQSSPGHVRTHGCRGC